MIDLQEHRQRAEAQHPAGGRYDRPAARRAATNSLSTGDDRGVRQDQVAQRLEGARRGAVAIGDMNRMTGSDVGGAAPPSSNPISVAHVEEIVEGRGSRGRSPWAMPSCTMSRSISAHLAARVDHVGGLGDARQIVDQRRFAVVDVEGRRTWPCFSKQEFRQQPRQQRLADAAAGANTRCRRASDDIDPAIAVRPSFRRSNPAPSAGSPAAT